MDHSRHIMALPNVPPHLTIRILRSDDDFVVIEKPCDLRSVPGHANQPPQEKSQPNPFNISSQSNRSTAQEAWVKAIKLCSEDEATIETESEENSIEEAAVKNLLKNLGTTANPSCVPRKLETFVKYCHRNLKRLLPDLLVGREISEEVQCEPNQKKQKIDQSEKSIAPLVRSIAQKSYAKIQRKQQPLINLPKPTEDWESAIGQLRLLGFGEYSPCVATATNERLHVVHRLDCQTSGVMVVARNQATASFFCELWRKREAVQKVYLAHVRHWPPYHEQKRKEGSIDLALAPSRKERIKWEVLPVAEGGKESKTYWKVYEDFDELGSNNEQEVEHKSVATEKKGITLELHPITGRTHQLRLHCAAVGSGIVGDSLYGDSPIAWSGDHPNTNENHQKLESNATLSIGTDIPKTLRLHAHKLTFPHPKSGESCAFESPKPW